MPTRDSTSRTPAAVSGEPGLAASGRPDAEGTTLGAATDQRIEAGDGFTVLDGGALVSGAAVASVHIRFAAPAVGGLDRVGWALLWITLAGVALTAAGPVVFLLRRYGRRPSNYPRTGDR